MRKILVITVAMVTLLVSWSLRDERVRSIRSSREISADDVPGSSPYLTKDNNGRTVLSWVRQANDSTSVLCYSVLDGSDKTIVIPGSTNIHAHAENLPKVIFKPSGEIIATWGVKNPNPANKYSGLVFYSQSFDNGATWTESKRLVDDETAIDQRYSDVALLKSGEVGIIWLDNRKTRAEEGSALYYASTNGKNGFGKGALISQPACPCCRTKMFVDRAGGIHALYRGIINDSIRDMVHIVSADGGKTFGSPERIFNDNWILRGCPHTGPSMTENENGLHFTWYTGGSSKGSFYIRSNDNGRSFKHHDSISAKGMHPQIATVPGDKLVIAWDESVKMGNDFNKRIGLQVRSGKGEREMDKFITPDIHYSTYPVVSAVDEDNIIVAYTSKIDSAEYVKWQKVSLGR